MAQRKCHAQHPTLDLTCDKTKHGPTVAHTATDENGEPHAWVTVTEPDE